MISMAMKTNTNALTTAITVTIPFSSSAILTARNRQLKTVITNTSNEEVQDNSSYFYTYDAIQQFIWVIRPPRQKTYIQNYIQLTIHPETYFFLKLRNIKDCFKTEILTAILSLSLI